MTPREQSKIMIVMVSLIVLLFICLSYIWFSEENYPLFGKQANNKRELYKLKQKLTQTQKYLDSLSTLQETIPSFELRKLQPDSSACKSCPHVELINGKYYDLLGSFHAANDARFLASQLLRYNIHDLKIFHRSGALVEEIMLYDSLIIK